MPKGVPLTPEEQDRRRHEIFEACMKLFIEQGFPETSMREVAAAVGIGKSTLYDYFRTKDEILVWGIEDIAMDLTVMARETAALPLPAAERLRRVMREHVAALDARKEYYLRLSFEVQRLSLKAQKRIQVRRHEYQDVVAQLIVEGIREGSFRNVDPLPVARMMIVATTPTIFTSRPSGTPQQMLDETLDVVLRGLQA
jgi:AcrR family transcriptional regulator